MPVNLIRYTGNPAGTSLRANERVNNDGNNVEGDPYSEYVYFAASTTNATRQIYNALGQPQARGDTGENTNVMENAKTFDGTNITLTLNDISDTKTNVRNWSIGGYTNLRLDKKLPALTASQVKNIQPSSTWELTNQLTNATKATDYVDTTPSHKISSTNFGHLVVNGKEGKWVLCYTRIPQSLSSKVTISDSKSSMYVDRENTSALFGVTTTVESNSGTNPNYDIIPMWFNLDDMDKTTGTSKTTYTTTVLFTLENSKTGATEKVERNVKIEVNGNS